GSGWMYATDGLPSTARHYLPPGQTAPLTDFLFHTMDRAGVDPEVDRALAELGVTYVYVSPPNYWGFQQPNEHLLELDATPGLAKVYSDSQVRIFAVRAAFSAAELRQVMESSPFRPAGRNPLYRPAGVCGAELAPLSTRVARPAKAYPRIRRRRGAHTGRGAYAGARDGRGRVHRLDPGGQAAVRGALGDGGRRPVPGPTGEPDLGA